MSAKNRGAASLAGNPHEYYQTPAWTTRAILHQLPKRCRYLDAGCGTGAIGSVVAAEGTPHGMVCGIELDPTLAAKAALAGLVVEEADFLQVPNSEWADIQVIIANPPYSLALEFLKKAIEIVKPNMGTVAMILRLPFLAGQLRASFHKEHPCDIYVLPRRPSFTGKGTDATDYAWFVWGPGRGHHWSILEIPEDKTDPRDAQDDARALKELQDAEDLAEFGGAEGFDDVGGGSDEAAGETDG
jgi:predicted RNA methylase